MKPVFTKRRGFTLIELLVVIAIIATLTTVGFVAKGFFDKKTLSKKAEAEIAMLSAAMTKYKEDNGGEVPYADGDEWSSHVLYRALSGDTSNNGKPNKASDGVQNTSYCPSLSVIRKGDKHPEEGIPVIKMPMTGRDATGKKKKGHFYAVIDPWGNPYRYRAGYETETDGKKGSGMNPDFDIYSQGPDGKGDSKNQKGDNGDNISNITYLS